MTDPDAHADTDETRAYRIIDDRRSVVLEASGVSGDWVDLEAATSMLEPGMLMVRNPGSDPVLLRREQIERLADLCRTVLDGTVIFPDRPRPCGSCGQVEHTVDDCEAAEWDPTPAGPRADD